MRVGGNTLDNLYFEWLCREVDTPEGYDLTLGRLYEQPFTYFIPNDDNRAQDGLELRMFFLETEGYSRDAAWEELPCSVLEMLVALARRMEFEGGGSISECFNLFMIHMGIETTWWAHSRYLERTVDHAVKVLNDRLYSYDGHNGGLFPLKDPPEDQRTVEIWYQMANYIREESAWTSLTS